MLTDPKIFAQSVLGVEADDEDEDEVEEEAEEVAHLDDPNRTLLAEENGGEMANLGDANGCPETIGIVVLAVGEPESDDEEYPVEERTEEEPEVISESVAVDPNKAAECKSDDTEDDVNGDDFGMLDDNKELDMTRTNDDDDVDNGEEEEEMGVEEMVDFLK